MSISNHKTGLLNSMFYTLYRIFSYLLLPAFLLGQWLKGSKNSAYRKHVNERLGYGSNPKDSYDIWLHAVSVGEVKSIVPLVKRLAKTHSIIVTVTTPTGRKTAKDLLSESAHIRYLPFDIGFCVRQFLDGIQPKQAVVVETEIWPNLIKNTKKRGIPLYYINVRLSERSFRRYQKVQSFSAEILNEIDTIAAQNEVDASRLKALGVIDEKIIITGSLKFDVQMPEGLYESAQNFRSILAKSSLAKADDKARIIWIAGSTREGEEKQLIEAYKSLKKVYPNLLLIIVPRHPERFDEVYKLCQDASLNIVRRTENPAMIKANIDVYLGDTLGELSILYAASDIAFVGGSLMPFGGQNILEPCALGVPVLFGPHMFNFEQISQLVVEADAGICVQSIQGLEVAISNLIQHPRERDEMSKQGLKLIEKNKGALEKVISLLT